MRHTPCSVQQVLQEIGHTGEGLFAGRLQEVQLGLRDLQSAFVDQLNQRLEDRLLLQELQKQLLLSDNGKVHSRKLGSRSPLLLPGTLKFTAGQKVMTCVSS